MIKTLIKKIESIGTNESMDLDTIRRIKISNKLLLIGLVSTFFFVLSDLQTGLYIPALTLSVTFCIVLFSFYLMKAGYSNLASFLAVVGASIAIFINAYTLVGEVGVSYILLSLIGVPVINIDISKRYLMLSAIVIISALFLTSILANFPAVGIYHISEDLRFSLMLGDTVVAVVLMVSQILFFLKEMDYRYTLHEEQHQKLMVQGRMSDLGIMSAGIAHEINNPLTIIQSHAMLLEKENDISVETDRDNQHIIKIKDNVQRISKIVQGIKHLSRDYSNDPLEKTSIQTIITHIKDTFNDRLKSLGVELNIKLVSQDAFILSRGAQIEQVLVSMISNALDSLKNIKNGTITISVKNDDYIRIYIEDNGQGIQEKDAPHLMKMFYTTKPTGQGTGMGLSIAKQIIENHDGTLAIDSLQPARFLITLPNAL